MPDYEVRREACFGMDGLHDFVIALRIMLHHLHNVEAGWNVTTNFSEGSKTATFTVSKAIVQRVIKAFPERFDRKSDYEMHVFINAMEEEQHRSARDLPSLPRAPRTLSWMDEKRA
jgi:hypothetical protein